MLFGRTGNDSGKQEDKALNHKNGSFRIANNPKYGRLHPVIQLKPLFRVRYLGFLGLFSREEAISVRFQELKPRFCTLPAEI
jgi:hypothetical protein